MIAIPHQYDPYSIVTLPPPSFFPNLTLILTLPSQGPTPTSAQGKLFRQPQVQAFVEWLQEEEEDDDEDEDDEEGEE